MYRAFLDALLVINPSMRVIGLTATPYRLGHGLITDKPAIFDDLLDPVTIEELIQKGFLAPLSSKVTKTNYDLSGVHKRGGEFIESELQAAVDTDENNDSVIKEVIALAEDRKSWPFQPLLLFADHEER
jgi:DNA repair protein RadD